ncbi:MAG: hypothetical protein WC515_06020 [Candidatus Omnitrophota bacterium]
MRIFSLCLIAAVLFSSAGCGISKDKYETLLNEKIMLEEKASVLVKAKDALKNEYDNLLKEKMDLATRVETTANEKNALKSEYDKLLDEKIALKASYDKLLADSKKTTP